MRTVGVPDLEGLLIRVPGRDVVASFEGDAPEFGRYREHSVTYRVDLEVGT